MTRNEAYHHWAVKNNEYVMPSKSRRRVAYESVLPASEAAPRADHRERPLPEEFLLSRIHRIRLYKNRKYYSLVLGDYITFRHFKEFFRRGDTILVEDVYTNVDVTPKIMKNFYATIIKEMPDEKVFKLIREEFPLEQR